MIWLIFQVLQWRVWKQYEWRNKFCKTEGSQFQIFPLHEIYPSKTYTTFSLRNWDVANYVHTGYQVVRRKNTNTDVLKLLIHFCEGLKKKTNLWNPHWHAVRLGRVISLLKTDWNTMETPTFAERKEIESLSACGKSDNFSILGYRRSHPNWIHALEHND
jgi:hypothetical protein